MPQYKLTYFDSRGLGEPIRQILTYSGVPFEDVRIPLGGLTPEKKKELRLEWDQVPALEIDGEQKAQSWAIARYLARKFNLTGKTEDEQFRTDEIVEAVRDFFQKAITVFLASFGPDTEKAEEAKKTFVDVDSPAHLKRFNNILEKNGKTWLVGDSLTYADIYLAHMVYNFSTILEVDLSKDFPAVVKLGDAVQNHPKLKQWFETRPKTKY